MSQRTRAEGTDRAPRHHLEARADVFVQCRAARLELIVEEQIDDLEVLGGGVHPFLPTRFLSVIAFPDSQVWWRSPGRPPVPARLQDQSIILFTSSTGLRELDRG